MLGDSRSVEALGEHLGQQLYSQEVDYLRSEEWAMRADDILWRRTKLGLALNAEEVSRLQRYLDAQPVPSRTADVHAA
jgi:glycerol-3-phosphate dehydrogenase